MFKLCLLSSVLSGTCKQDMVVFSFVWADLAGLCGYPRMRHCCHVIGDATRDGRQSF